MTSNDAIRPATAAELAAALAPARLLADYGAALHRRTDRLAEDTAGRYLRHVEHWLAYAAAHRVDPLAPGVEDVEHFAARSPVADGLGRDRPRTRRPSAEVTRQRLGALTAFYDWAHELGLTRTNPARALPRPQDPPGHGEDVRRLTPAEIAQTVAAARDDGPLAYALFRVLADVGVRGIEIQRATCRDYRPGADGGPVLHTIGRAQRRAMRRLPAVTVEALDEALDWRRATSAVRSGTHPAGPLFTAPRGHRHGPPAPLDSHRFLRVFRRVLRSSDVERPDEITAHAYRHAWVRHGVACGWSVTDVQAEIGHRSLSSTLRYLVGGVGTLHPLAATIRPLSGFVAESVVMLRAVSGGEALPVTEELAARRRTAASVRRELDVLRELHAARVEAALAQAELEQMRARLAALDPDFPEELTA